jgi:hypothetical protein
MAKAGAPEVANDLIRNSMLGRCKRSAGFVTKNGEASTRLINTYWFVIDAMRNTAPDAPWLHGCVLWT